MKALILRKGNIYADSTRDIPSNLQTREVLRRSGIRDDSKLKSEMETLIGKLLASVNDEHLLEPAVSYEIYPITDIEEFLEA